MKPGTVLRHIVHKDLLVLVLETGKSTAKCKVIPNYKEAPKTLIWEDNVKLPNKGIYKLDHFEFVSGRNIPIIELRLSRLNRSWKVDKVGTILYGQK